jgi:hypothetical protein
VIEHHREKVKDKAARQNAQSPSSTAANDAARGGDRNDSK